jgi:hypothetical protein
MNLRRGDAPRLIALLALPLMLAPQNAQTQSLSQAQRQAITQSVDALIARRDAEVRAWTHALIRRRQHTLVQFETALAAQPSATMALEGWCATRQFTYPDPAKVTAESFSYLGKKTPPIGLHDKLGIGPNEIVGIRHVSLKCGNADMSEAHNWYVPSRLTPEMNDTLANTETPFGKVVAPLHFTREPLDSHRGPDADCPADTVLTHRALLHLPDGKPLALVLECYRSVVLRQPGPIFFIPIPSDPAPVCTGDGAGHMQGPHCPSPPAPSNPPSPTLPSPP